MGRYRKDLQTSLPMRRGITTRITNEQAVDISKRAWEGQYFKQKELHG